MEAKFSSAAMTGLGLFNNDAVTKLVANDLVTKERRHGCDDVSMTKFDAGDDDGAAANTEEVERCCGPCAILGTFGINAAHSPRTDIATTMDNDAPMLVADNIMIGNWGCRCCSSVVVLTRAYRTLATQHKIMFPPFLC